MLCCFKKWKRKNKSKADRGQFQSNECCIRPSPNIMPKPDPLIYSQQFLMSQGIGVTWDNPDIHLQLNGIEVQWSEPLLPDTNYDIIARIWNGSNSATAINMPVEFSYIDFGIGGRIIPISTTNIDLPVRGSSNHPVFTKVKWKTPSIAGHYCIRVELKCNDDADPRNNIGQENVMIKKLNSPHADFEFEINNNKEWTRVLHLEIDTYTIPPIIPCTDKNSLNSNLNKDKQERLKQITSQHDRKNFPIPRGWNISIEPMKISLSPRQKEKVTININAPDGFSGDQVFNINGFDEHLLVGGVTLKVHS